MFQQEAESEAVQPNHNNNMPNSISEEPINRLPSNSGGSANRSQLFYTPNSSPEEPTHPLPSNLRGSSHQSNQFFEPEIELEEEEGAAESEGLQPNVSPSSQSNRINQLPSELDQLSRPESEDEICDQSYNCYLPLINAAQRGDWKSFIHQDPDLLTSRITSLSQTALHVAAISCQWGFILKLLGHLSRESIAVQDIFGSTILHYVAAGGSLKTAKALVQKNPDLPQMPDNIGRLPLITSIWSESNKELAWYLSLETKVDSQSTLLPEILRSLIHSGYHDIALHYVKQYPELAIAKDKDGNSLLYWLAENPSHFFSKSNLGLLERLIYKFVHVEIQNAPTHLVINMHMESFPARQSISFETQVLRWFKGLLRWFKRLLWIANAKMAPSVQKVRDAKLKHKCAVKLLSHVCTQLSEKSFKEILYFLKSPNYIMGIAIKGGIEEIVRTLLQHFPDLIYYDAKEERNIFQTAIKYRQEKIVKIIREISPTIIMALCSQRRESNTTLLMAGKLAPAFTLFSVSGVALQMQRELQWFKEVESMTFPSQRECKNLHGETAKDVFREKHKDLAKEGEKWMKETANSCMLVTALIATVLFAAAFTVPGGNKNNDKGTPIFLRTNAFTIFAILDALGLFSSLTSLLMFLAILTARYEVEDFLKSLPKKLIIGLGSLFVSIASMIIAFGAALTIMLNERWHWVFVPINLLASFPVVIFVMLQLPLFVQMVRSTYGVSIFRPWPSRKFE